MSGIQEAIQQIPDRIDRICEDALAAISSASSDYKAVLDIELVIPQENIDTITAELDRLAPLLAVLQ